MDTPKIKRLEYGDKDIPIHYRDGTSDRIILESVLTGQEYQIPDSLNPEVIFDIGANIGVTSVWLANRYPKARIFSFEPVESNFDLLVKNTLPYANISAFEFGLAKYDGESLIYASDDATNHGGFSIFKHGVDLGKSIKVKMRSVEYFMDQKEIEKVDLIKIDCEGSEHEILTSIPPSKLRLTSYIVGELHGTHDFPLLSYLSHHFSIGVHKPINSRIGKFCCARNGVV